MTAPAACGGIALFRVTARPVLQIITLSRRTISIRDREMPPAYSRTIRPEAMERTRNITVCVSESTYHQARVWAAQRGTSVSAAVQFLLENLSAVSRAVRYLHEEDPNFGAHSRLEP